MCPKTECANHTEHDVRDRLAVRRADGHRIFRVVYANFIRCADDTHFQVKKKM